MRWPASAGCPPGELLGWTKTLSITGVPSGDDETVLDASAVRGAHRSAATAGTTLSVTSQQGCGRRRVGLGQRRAFRLALLARRVGVVMEALPR